ncbi:MAG TPA: ATP synthase F1 subunit gamma [Candidatus Paceibacterota bacterium]|nr:ATP synthase F1 subunit gamma [Candidatus Paceibacterota bacterium]HPT18134.1 ATP synthase F1 subunit gamma [Candidatus Paceibacterota bacterium]
MPLATKAIKQKIKSVGSIGKITKTMEMVSVSKMRRAVDQALSSRSYSHYALELLVNLSKDKNVSNLLMLVSKKAEVSNKELIIVVASNKGLCGGYHTNLFKALSSYVNRKETNNKEIQSVTIGKHAEKICKKLGIQNFASFITFSEASSIEQTRELSALLAHEFTEGNFSSIKILYTEFLKSTIYKPVLREIFPISVETIKNILEVSSTEVLSGEETAGKISNFDFTDYKFEPDLNTILGNILPGLVDVVIYQTLAEAFASEHSARMFAMKNAEDSATAILHSLTLQYNHARQDGITRELSEIVGGAEALANN